MRSRFCSFFAGTAGMANSRISSLQCNRRKSSPAFEKM